MYIKSIIKMSLLAVLVSSLSARENPFEAAPFVKMKEEVLEKQEIIIEPFNQNDKGRTLKIISQDEKAIAPIQRFIQPPAIIPEPTIKEVAEVSPVEAVEEPKNVEEITIAKEEIKTTVETKTTIETKQKIEEEPKETTIIKEEIQKILAIEKKTEEITITKEKVKDPVTKEVIAVETKTYKYNLLEFVKINITDDVLNIKTSYDLDRKFLLVDENKMVFDFIGKINFSTQREGLSTHDDYKKIIIGAHPEERFFRVVIQAQEDVTKYKIVINKDGLIVITKK